MFSKTLVLIALFSAVSAAPSQEILYSPVYDLTVQSKTTSSLFDIVCNIIQTAISSKISAVGIGVHLIEWIVSNISVIIFGAIAAFGVCKLTDLCKFNYEEYIPIASLKSYATPDRLETAERFLLTALDKYAEKKKRDI
ncbi:hypothetical protein K1T71_006739 [Dendrolimus kikuchii]|uniref:Uncharacterized protein n=1 Tax=Dendrolimus kikuchii TaxID=765133 RepID=A0ACC1D200_9NEOP|nr:hypothetical protein K1T71_006739 [Dendrolimus kikuchii]